jgi:hypothetical protein
METSGKGAGRVIRGNSRKLMKGKRSKINWRERHRRKRHRDEKKRQRE